MMVGGESVHGNGVDFAALNAVFIMLRMVAVRLYPMGWNEPGSALKNASTRRDQG